MAVTQLHMNVVRQTPTLCRVACFKNKAATTYKILLNKGKSKCIRRNFAAENGLKGWPCQQYSWTRRGLPEFAF